MAANTLPTPSSDCTPSPSRAPPECQSPITGARMRSAVSMVSTMRPHPTEPMAPPSLLASVQ